MSLLSATHLRNYRILTPFTRFLNLRSWSYFPLHSPCPEKRKGEPNGSFRVFTSQLPAQTTTPPGGWAGSRLWPLTPSTSQLPLQAVCVSCREHGQPRPQGQQPFLNKGEFSAKRTMTAAPTASCRLPMHTRQGAASDSLSTCDICTAPPPRSAG